MVSVWKRILISDSSDGNMKLESGVKVLGAHSGWGNLPNTVCQKVIQESEQQSGSVDQKKTWESNLVDGLFLLLAPDEVRCVAR